RADVMDKVVYVATNPVLDHLVERVHHWPGAKTTHALLEQTGLRATRPGYFFRADGLMPESVELRFTIPPELGDVTTTLSELRDRIAEVEAEQAAIRAATGARVLGRRAVLRQSWRESPSSREPRRGLRPRVASRSKWSRIAALLRNNAFVTAYRHARAALLAGTPVL